MPFRKAMKLFGRVLLGAPLLFGFLTIIYGIFFVPPLVAVGFVVFMTFAICNVPLYLSPDEDDLDGSALNR